MVLSPISFDGKDLQEFGSLLTFTRVRGEETGMYEKIGGHYERELKVLE